jgi:hypothetical protein
VSWYIQKYFDIIFIVNEQFDIIIIGAGPAGLAAASKLASSEYTFAVFETGLHLSDRRRNAPESIIKGVGGAGLYSDGKFSFFPSATALWHLEDPESLYNSYSWLGSLLKEVGYTAPDFPVTPLKESQCLSSQEFKQYPSLCIPFEKREALISKMEAEAGEALHTASRVVRINQKPNGFVIYVDAPQGIITVSCKAVIFAGGRFGPTILTQLIPTLPTIFNRIEIGIRVEQQAEDFIFRTHPSVDVKKISNGEGSSEEWRTFCTCRNGEVIETDWDGIQTFSGRADGSQTNLSNMGINLRLTTSPSDKILLAELHNALTGNIAQFVVSGSDYFNESSCFFGKILDDKFRCKLKDIFPKESLDKVKIYGPCLEGFGRYPDLNETLKVNSHDIWIAGDAVGKFRGLTAGLISGRFAAEQVVKHFKRSAIAPAFIKESPTKPMTVIFTAQSKAFFYCRDAVCEFVLKQGLLPINPFRVFEYFLGDRVERNIVRQGNNQLVELADELWVFGPVADGVLFEIIRARERHKPVRYFSIATRSSEIKPISVNDVTFEPEVHARQIKRTDLLALLSDTLTIQTQPESPQLKLALEDIRE